MCGIPAGERAGLVFVKEKVGLEEGEGWLGRMEVGGLDREGLAARKRACRLWIGRWAGECVRV